MRAEHVRGWCIAEAEEGLVLPALGLALDPLRPPGPGIDTAFVSHAHVDRPLERAANPSAGGRREGLAANGPPSEAPEASPLTTFGTPETGALLEALGRLPRRFQPRAFGERWRLRLHERQAGGGEAQRAPATSIEAWLEPAGHMLGAAQLVLEGPDGVLRYLPDATAAAGRSYGACARPQADVLVLGSSFALPIVRFPTRAHAEWQVISFCRQALADGHTPYLMADAVSVAMELLLVLGALGFSVRWSAALAPIVAAYQSHGVAMPRCERDAVEAIHVSSWVTGTGKPSARSPVRRDGRPQRRRTALVSAWSLFDAALERTPSADVALVWPEQGDLDEKLALLATSGAEALVTSQAEANALAAVVRMNGERAIRSVPFEGEAIDRREPGEPGASVEERDEG